MEKRQLYRKMIPITTKKRKLHSMTSNMNDKPVEYSGIDDGITHVNIYSAGKTKLGRALSNFAHCKIQHPVLGTFASMEGLHYFLGTDRRKETGALRHLYGKAAKLVGRKFAREKTAGYKTMMLLGMVEKANSDSVRQMLVDLEYDLPFTHYYCWYNGDGSACKTTVVHGHEWQTEMWEHLRTLCRKGFCFNQVSRYILKYLHRQLLANKDPDDGILDLLEGLTVIEVDAFVTSLDEI